MHQDRWCARAAAWVGTHENRRHYYYSFFFFLKGLLVYVLSSLVFFFPPPQVFCLMLACVRACKYLFFSFFLSFLAAKAPARVYYNVQTLIAFLFFFFFLGCSAVNRRRCTEDVCLQTCMWRAAHLSRRSNVQSVNKERAPLQKPERNTVFFFSLSSDLKEKKNTCFTVASCCFNQ